MLKIYVLMFGVLLGLSACTDVGGGGGLDEQDTLVNEMAEPTDGSDNEVEVN